MGDSIRLLEAQLWVVILLSFAAYLLYRQIVDLITIRNIFHWFWNIFVQLTLLIVSKLKAFGLYSLALGVALLSGLWNWFQGNGLQFEVPRWGMHTQENVQRIEAESRTTENQVGESSRIEEDSSVPQETISSPILHNSRVESQETVSLPNLEEYQYDQVVRIREGFSGFKTIEDTFQGRHTRSDLNQVRDTPYFSESNSPQIPQDDINNHDIQLRVAKIQMELSDEKIDQALRKTEEQTKLFKRPKDEGSSSQRKFIPSPNKEKMHSEPVSKVPENSLKKPKSSETIIDRAIDTAKETGSKDTTCFTINFFIVCILISFLGFIKELFSNFQYFLLF